MFPLKIPTEIRWGYTVFSDSICYSACIPLPRFSIIDSRVTGATK